MTRLYGQLVQRFGFAEIREASSDEVDAFCRGLDDTEDEEPIGRGGEVSAEELERIIALEKAAAKRDGGTPNPLR